MSDHTNDPTEPNDDRSGSGHWLTSLLSALERLERGRSDASATGRRRGNSMRLNYDISIGSGLDRAIDRVRTDRSGSRSRSRDRPRRRRRSSSPDGHVASRRHGEELLVTADVDDAGADDITVGFDGDELVVGVSGSELDRVEVPWTERTATASFKNGVLTVVVEPTEDEQ
ncbi:gas vesicle protein GvpH [Natronococcus occultus]|uniref:Molecular chaperone (Small heat shock protein) n=1 Tax=Natronococcus occultus SP4 TaxID=694430 RepID=L0JZV5_9EURY|nr:gas vesicle protein GvpH [Natronococcus occultus]AGB38587.1 molecular chaperone (small heat shock protein) [Natronococcus occultus SP4]